MSFTVQIGHKIVDCYELFVKEKVIVEAKTDELHAGVYYLCN